MESKRIPFEGILTPDQLQGGMIRYRWTIRNRHIAVAMVHQVKKDKGIVDDVPTSLALTNAQWNELWSEARTRLISRGFHAAATGLSDKAGSAI